MSIFLKAPLAVLASVAAMFVALAPMPAAAEVSVGSKAPDFALPDANGTTHTLSQYQGKIVVLEWTNHTCPFVKRHYQAGTMKKLAEKYASQNVVWLAIDSSHFVEPTAIKKWIEEQKLPYPVLLDPTGEVGKGYGAKTTPHMFIVDQKGNLAYSGAIDDDPRGEKSQPINYVDQALAKLTAGAQPEVTNTQSYGCSVKYKK